MSIERPNYIEQNSPAEKTKPQVTDEVWNALAEYYSEAIEHRNDENKNLTMEKSFKKWLGGKSPKEYFTGVIKEEIETLARIPLEAQETLLRKPENMTQEEYGNELSWLAEDISCGLIIAEADATGDGYALTSMQPNVEDDGHHEIYKSRNHRLVLHNASRLRRDQRDIIMANKNEWLINIHHLNSQKQK